MFKQTFEISHEIRERKAECPKCKGRRNAKIVASIKGDWEEVIGKGMMIYGSDTNCLLQCNGCDEVYFARYSYFSEDSEEFYDDDDQEWRLGQVERETFFPAPDWKSPPEWFSTALSWEHGDLYDLMLQTYGAANRNWFTLAAMGVRTCFDVAGEVIGIDPDLPFKDKIEQLRSKGHISPREKMILESLVDIGSAAAHRGWKPQLDDVRFTLSALENFVHHAIILPKELDKAKNRPKKGTEL